MGQPRQPGQDDDFHAVLRRLDQEFGARQDAEPPDGGAAPAQPGAGSPPPVSGEVHPIPPRSIRLPLPTRRPWAFMVLLVINIGIFILPAILDLLGIRVIGIPPGALILALGAKNNEAIYLDGQYYRFLTAMFLHGGVLHIAFNGFALYSIGPEAERIYGTLRFLALYFIAGLAGGVASYALTPTNSVGASGAIFGLIGGLAAFYYVARGLLGQLARQQLGSLITIIMINLFLGFSAPNIDNMAHIGGLVGGAAAGWFLAPRFDIDDRLYPPEVVRQSLPFAWVGALALLGLVVGLARAVVPPL